jgi:hypothetical protein
MLIVGLVLLAAAVVVGIAGVSANTGAEHQLAGGFAIFGYHVHGSAGKLFLAGLLIGAVGMLGFLLATEGLRRNAALRRELFRFRRQARAQERAQATAPAPRRRVLARTAPAPAADVADTETSAGKSAGTGTSTDTGTSTGTGTDTTADTAEGDSASRRSLRNWRTPRPTS